MNEHSGPRKLESITASLHPGGLVRIRSHRLERGVNVGGDLWLGVEALPWLTGALAECIDKLTRSERTIGADSLRVSEKGHELDPKIGIGNVRADPALHAGRYFVVVSEALVLELVVKLKRLSKQAR